MAWMRSRDNSGGQQKDYLNAADTAGRPMALASILFTLLFIAAIALLLFSAGRWAYNQMIDEEITVTTTQQEAAKKDNAENADVIVETTPDTTVTADTSVSDGAATDTGTSTTESSANSTSTATAPVTTAAVPKTGPGSVLGLFVVTVILASVAHYRYQVVKNRS